MNAQVMNAFPYELKMGAETPPNPEPSSHTTRVTPDVLGALRGPLLTTEPLVGAVETVLFPVTQLLLLHAAQHLAGHLPWAALRGREGPWGDALACGHHHGRLTGHEARPVLPPSATSQQSAAPLPASLRPWVSSYPNPDLAPSCVAWSNVANLSGPLYPHRGVAGRLRLHRQKAE